MFCRCDTDFNLERHLIPFLQDNVFFAEISRQILKVPTKQLPTAAIAYDPKADELTMFWNPEFFESLSNWEIRGVLKHEFYHLIFGHLSTRRHAPPGLWNVATDLAINSLIIENAGRARDVGEDEADARPLPRCALIPGQWPVKPDGREMSKEEKDGAKLAALIASFPKLQASEWYFGRLQEFAQENSCPVHGSGAQRGQGQTKERGSDGGDAGGENDNNSDHEHGDSDNRCTCTGEGWIDSMDDHSSWDALPDEQREYVEGKLKAIVERAARVADQQSNGWGDIPADVREDIRRWVSGVVNWRSVLRQFVGSLFRGGRSTSIKRINRRYPYIHPGLKRGYQAKLLIAMDQSGSVPNEMVEMFFAELSNLTKKVDVTILPFDCSCSERDTLEWKKGTVPKLRRTKMGGTDFSAPTKVFNDPKNRGRWDGMLIMTDGAAPAPIPARAKRGWILGEGCSLMFKTSELQISLSKEKPLSGAWR